MTHIKLVEPNLDDWLNYAEIRRFALKVYQDATIKSVALDKSLDKSLLEVLFLRISKTKIYCQTDRWKIALKVN